MSLFPTCVTDSVAPQVGVAAVRVLRRLGYEVDVPHDATCCGQPAWNAGYAEAAATVARTTLAALESADADVICVPAGSCTTMIRVFWPELFHVVGDRDAQKRAEMLAPSVREFSELVADHDVPGDVGSKVAYHHSCHMLRELRIEGQPTELLSSVGCELVEWTADQRCCGFGGTFSVKQPELSVAMADDKIDTLLDSAPDVLVGCDQSCLMHLQGRLRHRGEDLPVKHLAEVLDEAADD